MSSHAEKAAEQREEERRELERSAAENTFEFLDMFERVGVMITAAILSEVSADRWERCLPQALELYKATRKALAAERRAGSTR